MPASSTIRIADVAPQSWRNGGGETRALLVRPRGDRWLVRVSVADVDANGPFSRFPGVQRWFAVLEGEGVILTIGTKEHRLGCDDDAISFRGDAVVRCRLVAGATRDLNLMLSGIPGTMQRVVPGQAWRPEARECGLYATSAGRTIATMPDESAPMPANALRWWAEAPGSLAFDGAGWWLAAGAKDAAP